LRLYERGSQPGGYDTVRARLTDRVVAGIVALGSFLLLAGGF